MAMRPQKKASEKMGRRNYSFESMRRFLVFLSHPREIGHRIKLTVSSNLASQLERMRSVSEIEQPIQPIVLRIGL